jgi:hypothetical protein
MEIERAQAISEVAQTLINTAKVELQFMELVGKNEQAPFFEQPQLPGRTVPASH